jgi:hypothetical protein
MTRPGESFIEWIKEQYRKVYFPESENDAKNNNNNQTVVRTFGILLFILLLSLKSSFLLWANPKIIVQ